MDVDNKDDLNVKLPSCTEIDLIVYQEICCDECNNIIHNHIDCPVCKTDYADTDMFCELYDEVELKCDNCNTIFIKTSDSWYHNCRVKIKEVIVK